MPLKFDLLSILPEGTDEVAPVSFDFKVLDGAAIVHLLQTKTVTMFDDYLLMYSFLISTGSWTQLNMLMWVWDSYLSCSIGINQGEKRQRNAMKGGRKEEVSHDWLHFLHDAINKQEFFNFLSLKIELMCREKENKYSSLDFSNCQRY